MAPKSSGSAAVSVDMTAFDRVPESLLAFKNLSYTVTVPGDASVDGAPSTVHKMLLNDIQGYVKSGSLLALMGFVSI